jgi:hypothetical protein
MIFNLSWPWSRQVSTPRKITHRIQFIAPAIPHSHAKRGYVQNTTTRLMLEKKQIPCIELK